MAPSCCFADPGSGTKLAPKIVVAEGSSSLRLPDAPASSSSSHDNSATLGRAGGGGIESFPGIRPFSTLAFEMKAGTGGVGFDVATPLARKLNLRGGASFFNYSHHFNEDGIGVDGTLNFRTVSASLDFFPFGGGFRISPGVVLYNGNHVMANASVPGGQSFTLNDVNYTSSITDPVGGTFDVSFGHKAAPSLTVGFGNMIPRSGRHWSVPVEIGFEYIGAPLIALGLSGSACSTAGCGSVQTDPTIKANVLAEQNKLNDDISPLRFYPIASIGIGYRF